MAILESKSGYEELRSARISQNQARLASLGLKKTIAELPALPLSPKCDKSHVRKCRRVNYSSTPSRRSARLGGKSPPPHDDESERSLYRTVYEELRNARISENQARLASLGIKKAISELQAMASSPKCDKSHVRKHKKVDYSSIPLRRSSRLGTKSPTSRDERKSDHLEGDDDSGEENKGTVNGTMMKRGKRVLQRPRVPLEALARRCESKSRGSLYHPVYGICCHFCRQKKMCGEEDCKRCGDLDMDQPCTGKTDCSNCHSANGILCRGCLKVRYSEEMEEVRANKEWMCPHCVELKGIKPYWICNSSLCLKKRKMVPTGIAIFTAREKGYKSVAHLLMDEIRQRSTTRS